MGPVIHDGATYTLPSDMPKEKALSYWFSEGHQVFIAEDGQAVLGTYFLRRNQQGGGSHVANCGYMTAPSAQRRGTATAMCQHSIQHARSQGFRAMQFNFVVCTNAGAIRLWKKLGFETVGRLPKAFRHPALGFVDALVMHKSFEPSDADTNGNKD